jgi:segregation and condensation protein B
MAFNLQKVLRALLFAAQGPLTVRDIQETVTRFHQREFSFVPRGAPNSDPTAAVKGDAGGHGPQSAAEPPVIETDAQADEESVAELDAELYREVPSLVTAAQIREAMDAIAADLRARDEVFFLIEGVHGYRLVSNPKVARWVRILRDEPPPIRLSQAALETLAVVAYRQPVTRSEIEQIRGVAAEAGLNKLLERGLIYVAGRADLPGRPIQSGTTDEFLEFVGIKSLEELPASDVLSNRQIDDWLHAAANPAHLDDRAMGLETEELPLEGEKVVLGPAETIAPAAADDSATAAVAPGADEARPA